MVYNDVTLTHPFFIIVGMKKILLCLFVGLILFYFLDIAFHVKNFNVEMFVHNLLRFFVGFILIGIWVWHKQKLKFMTAVYIILALLLADSISDYMRDLNNLRFEMMIHDALVIAWGAITGYLFVRHLNDKKHDPPYLK